MSNTFNDFCRISADGCCRASDFLRGGPLFFNGGGNSSRHTTHSLDNGADPVIGADGANDRLLDTLHLGCDFVRRISRLVGQAFDLRRADSETVTRIPGTGGFNCGVEGQ